MNYQEIVDRLKAFVAEDPYPLKHGMNEAVFLYNGAYYGREKELGLGSLNQVHSWGGEGEGDNIGFVMYFEDHDVYIAVSSYYESWAGDFFDSSFHMQEVYPNIKIEKTYIGVKANPVALREELETLIAQLPHE